jgi:hypothetical protein
MAAQILDKAVAFAAFNSGGNHDGSQKGRRVGKQGRHIDKEHKKG